MSPPLWPRMTVLSLFEKGHGYFISFLPSPLFPPPLTHAPSFPLLFSFFCSAYAAAAAQPALPAGWTSATDPSSGRVYYMNTTTGVTSWEYPSAHGDQGYLSPVAPKKKLSIVAKSQWSKILGYARQEASSIQQSKQKRFMGIRKFTDVVNKRKAEAAAKKAQGGDGSASPDGVSGATSIMGMLEVDVPPIEKYSMEEFAEASFNLNRKGFFGKKTTVAKALSHKNELIKTSLLKLPTKELETQAILTFRNITGFMGDRESRKEETGHAEKILKAGSSAPEELRDEFFCQIIKQTINNPSPESTLKGWMLLGILAGAISPSRDFEKYLLSYCESHREDSHSVGEYARYCMGRVIKTAALPPRREVCTSMEVEAAKMRLPVLLRVYHLDGSFDMMPVTSWVTPSLLKGMVCKKRGMKNSQAFGIFEMTPEGDERFLEQEERLLDLVAYWQRLFEEERVTGDDGQSKKQRKRALGSNFYRVVFKVHMYFDIPKTDISAQHEMFVQASYDVVSARYPCGERDCITLASLQIQAEVGDVGISDLQTKLARYMPSKYVEGTRTGEISNEIRKLHAAQQGKTAEQVEQEYLEYVQEWQVYGSSFFYVEPQMSADLPDEVFLAVNPKGILIISPESKEVLASHPYNEVPTWGHSASSFVLHIGNLMRQTKIYFATEQGKEINELVRSYVNNIINQS